MSDYFGDIRLGDTIDVKFTTRQISGAPSTLSGVPVISAYPSNSVTQLTAGITLTVDFDSVTGYNNVRVVATSGNGYLTATNYDLCITTGTVNSVSVVGESIGSFSIENRSALMPTTVARTLVVDASGLADANMVKAGPTGSGTAITARDIGASVLLSTGTGTGQLDFTSGVVKANATQWLGGTIPAVNVTGVPLVDLKYTLGTISPATAGSVRADAVTGSVGSVTGLTASNLDATISSRATPAQILTTALTESYAGQGVVPTLAQILFETRALQAEKAVAGTTLTAKKIDGSTTAGTYTLNDAVAPSAITRAT